MIDRIAPTRRPAGAHDGTQRWESLLFCHWEVPPDALRPLVPDTLHIDTFEGRTYVGIVPFKMRKIRPRWLPNRWALNFLETNVRVYVVYNGEPGVYFFSLDASSRLAVLAGRVGWSLPYHFAAMSSQADVLTTPEALPAIDSPPAPTTRSEGESGLYHYRSLRRGGRASHEVSFRLEEELGPSEPGTLEHFLLERYLLFRQRHGRIETGQVHHQPYHAWRATVDRLADRLAIASGIPSCDRQPDLAHFCFGVDVEVFARRR